MAASVEVVNVHFEETCASFLKATLTPIPYFACVLRHATTADVNIPNLEEHKIVITPQSIMQLVEFHVGWRSREDELLPDKYQTATRTVRVADFLGDTEYISYICSVLKIPTEAVMGKWSVRVVKNAIRDAYRRRSHVSIHFPPPTVCQVCRLGKLESAPTETTITVCCCKSLFHRSCLRNLSCGKCPKCATFWRLLPCAICCTHFSREDEQDPYSMYESNVEHRTPCCGADRHKTCIDNSMDKCPICQVPWNQQGQVDHELMSGPDYIYMIGNRWKNEKHRSRNTHYFLQPKWRDSTPDYTDFSHDYVDTSSPLCCSSCSHPFDACTCSEYDSDFSGDGCSTSHEEHNNNPPHPPCTNECHNGNECSSRTESNECSSGDGSSSHADPFPTETPCNADSSTCDMPPLYCSGCGSVDTCVCEEHYNNPRPPCTGECGNGDERSSHTESNKCGGSSGDGNSSHALPCNAGRSSTEMPVQCNDCRSLDSCTCDMPPLYCSGCSGIDTCTCVCENV